MKNTNNNNTNTNNNNTNTNAKEVKKLYKKIQNNSKNIDEYLVSVEYYKKIVELNPKNINMYLRELGELYEKHNLFYEAVECYVKIIKTDNDISTIGVLKNQIGICYFNLKQFKLAIHYFKQVLLIKEIDDVLYNIGKCYMQLKNYKDAEYNLLKSFEITPSDKCYNELAELYYQTKKYNQSIECYKKMQIYISNRPDVVFAGSLPYLANKKFETGFELYEKRLLYNNINKQTNKKDRLEIPSLNYWNGVDKCNRLVIVSEQGIGDNIQYYRFIIELAEKYPEMKIDFFCRNEIQGIFKTYGNIGIIKDMHPFLYEFKLYIMSLPKILGLTTIIPNKINYININEERLQFWKNKTDESLTKLKVGFVYNGLLSSFIEKNIPLKEYGLLCDLDIDLICIHKKSEIESDLNSISFRDKITHYDIDLDEPFMDTIHLLSNLDLLVTVDTFIVHLAGIMNVKTWLLLGDSEWRWSDDESQTYWYNSVELIRKKENEQFKDTLKMVKQKLIEMGC